MYIIGVTGDKLFTGVNGFSVIASVVDTNDIFITGDNDTSNKFMAVLLSQWMRLFVVVPMTLSWPCLTLLAGDIVVLV